MTVFSRFRDIISSNINALLDKAEDPEKLLKLMIREMEDTLVELKASCAGAMASRSKATRNLTELENQVKNWAARAQLAVEKGSEDLAREALLEKRAYREKCENVRLEVGQHSELVQNYQNDIQELENKLEQARNKYRVLLQRHIHATKKKQAQTDIRRAKSADTMLKFNQFESRIDQLEADANLVNVKTDSSLEEKLQKLETDEALEQELAELKKHVSPNTPQS